MASCDYLTMSTTATDTTHGADLRRKSSAVVGTEETRNVVDITQLNQEDAALAAQFGYTPVLSNSISLRFPLSFQPFTSVGALHIQSPATTSILAKATILKRQPKATPQIIARFHATNPCLSNKPSDNSTLAARAERHEVQTSNEIYVDHSETTYLKTISHPNGSKSSLGSLQCHAHSRRSYAHYTIIANR